MTIHYVDSNASGLNDGTSWTDAYADITTALAGSVVADDTIHCASDHAKTYAGTTTLTFPDNITVISVNSSTDEYTFGAKEQTPASTSYNFIIQSGTAIGEALTVIGMEFEADNVIQHHYLSVNAHRFYNCELVCKELTTETSTNFAIDLINCEINCLDEWNALITINGPLFIDNLTLSGTNQSEGFIQNTSDSTTIIKNTDLSIIVDATDALFNQYTTAYREGTFIAERCKLKASQVILGTLSQRTYHYDLYSCDIGDGYHYFEYGRPEGVALESTTVFRSGGATYDEVNGFTTEVQTNGRVKSYTKPLEFDLGNFEVNLTAGAILTVHLIQQDSSFTPTSLTDHLFWIEATYPDATDNALGVTVSSRTADILDTPNTLTTSTATWTGTSGNVNKQQCAVAIPTVAMTRAPVKLTAFVAKDITVADVSGATGIEMFVCSDPVVT